MEQGEEMWLYLSKLMGLSRSVVRSVVTNEDTSEPLGHGNHLPRNTALPSPYLKEDQDLQEVLKEITISVIAEGHKDGRPLTEEDIFHQVSNIVKWDEDIVSFHMFRVWMRNVNFFYASHDVGSPSKPAQALLANIVQTKGFLDEVMPYIDQGYLLVFDDESYLQNSHVRRKSWYHAGAEETSFQHAKGYKGDRWCFQAVLSPDGVVPGTYQRFKGGSGKDYHASFNGKQYFHWFQDIALPALRTAYPGRKIVWVTDSAAYHKVTSIALANPDGSGVTPTTKKGYEEACKKLGCDVKGKTMKDLKIWAYENYKDEPILPDIAYQAGVQLVYQPPSFSECNAIERIWAWVKNKIAMDHPPSTRSFAELGSILDAGMQEVTFSVRQDRIQPPVRPVDVAGLYRSTIGLYRSQRERTEAFLERDLNRQRFAALDARLDQGRRPKQAEKEVIEQFPSPPRPSRQFQADGNTLTPKTALRVRSVSSAESVQTVRDEDNEVTDSNPANEVMRELDFTAPPDASDMALEE